MNTAGSGTLSSKGMSLKDTDGSSTHRLAPCGRLKKRNGSNPWLLLLRSKQSGDVG